MHGKYAPRNSQNPRTKDAISLGPSGNLQGGALITGKKIVRCSWYFILIPDTVLRRADALVSDQLEQLVFNDRHGHPIGDVEIPGVDTS